MFFFKEERVDCDDARYAGLIWLLVLIGHLYLSGVRLRCESKNGHQNYMRLEEIGLR